MNITRESWEKYAEKLLVPRFETDGVEGLDHHLNGRYVGFNFDEQYIITRYTFGSDSWVKNGRGEVHGGIIAAIFDTSMGKVANFLTEQKGTTTADFNVSYIRPLSPKVEIEVKNYVVKAGRRAIRMRGEMYDLSTGKLIATSSGTWMPFIAR